jgi:hypothetical protein
MRGQRSTEHRFVLSAFGQRHNTVGSVRTLGARDLFQPTARFAGSCPWQWVSAREVTIRGYSYAKRRAPPTEIRP